ncbi:5-oxoprolinase subunit PxpB [Bermanella marisrubri]|uniref:Carboxyltransferase domain-containing protein n=1 Tax=Bermanella marisrubri TaxID=207949 RepID=Q1N2K1_9GAMM|nr:5-oxoprolinase subunit PxpB [Bermanella marisrubri]EAT12406.1 hypothetical protein RED65_16251 [Oceanobacter sp. RED65] [Bermanella marisrubri]QIZ85487.1 5-oxoprolinase subunit PxpB [Bermanella marisrubri]
MNIHVAGENALIVYVGDQVSPEVTQNILHLCQQLRPYVGRELIDLVPSYASVLVIFDPLKIDHLAVRKWIRFAYESHFNSHSDDQRRLVRLPVYYAGPDLQRVAEHKSLSSDEVVERHSSQSYQVYAIGFAPGFAYLGELDESLVMPRLDTPRKRVPKGAVAIADRQTAVYPKQSPGGWNLIGYCPIPMFEPEEQPPMPVQSGDLVQFYAIDEQTFFDMGGELPKGEIA